MDTGKDICQSLAFCIESAATEPDEWPIVSCEPSKYFGAVDRSEEAGLGIARLYCEGDFKPRSIVRWAARLTVSRGNRMELGTSVRSFWRPDRMVKIHSFLDKQIEITAISSMIDERTFSVDYRVNAGVELGGVRFGLWTESVRDEGSTSSASFDPNRRIIVIHEGSTGRWVGFTPLNSGTDWGFYENPERAEMELIEGRLNRLHQLKARRIIICQKIGEGNTTVETQFKLMIAVGESWDEVLERLNLLWDASPEHRENRQQGSHVSAETGGWPAFLNQHRIESTHPQLQKAHLYGLYIVKANAVEAIASQAPGITRPSLLPSKMHYYGLWLWDTFFLGLPLLWTSEYRLAEGSLLTLLDNQLENGLVPIATFPMRLEPHPKPLTQAPVLAMFGWAIFQAKVFREGRQSAVDFLKTVYSKLVNFHSFWYRERDRDQDGMCEYIHGWESGVDNSPYWDRRGAENVEDVLLALFLYLDCKYLSTMAHVLGRSMEQKRYASEALRIGSTILTEMYDEASGLFYSRYFDTHELIKVKTFESLLPLLMDDISSDQRRSIVEHLTDPNAFWTPYPVPTVALDEPHYGSKFSGAWWRKPVWMSANWLLLKGLAKWGYYREARHIIDQTIKLVLHSALEGSGIRRFGENYDPQTGQMTQGQASFFGWNGLISSMITEFLGGIDLYHPEAHLFIDPLCGEKLKVQVFDCFVSTEKERYTFGFDRSRMITAAQGVKCGIKERTEKQVVITLETHDAQPRTMTAYGEYFRSDIRVHSDGRTIGKGMEVSWIQEHFPAVVEIAPVQ